MAAAEGVVDMTLPAARGDILDRDGAPLAASVTGKMVVADPLMTADDAPEIATILSTDLGVDYFTALESLREEGSRFEYLDRRVPATKAENVVAKLAAAGYEGVTTHEDPVRNYPAGEVAANLVGFMGTDEPLGGFERTFDAQLSGTDGRARYTQGQGYRVPLAENSITEAVDGKPLHTTIDRDLQWFTTKALAQTVEDYRAKSGAAIVMDSRTGEVLALADVPTFDANAPLESPKEDLGSRALSEPYEPGSVQKVLTAASLVDAGKVTARTKIKSPPSLARQDRTINDWFDHGVIKLTMAGVIAQSSNIGTVLATDAFTPAELTGYLSRFGLGEPTGVGVRGETRGILTPGEVMTSQTKDRVAFGQSLSVNALQMTAAVNTVANKGVRVSPSLIQGRATMEDGTEVGTEVATRTRVVSRKAARQTALMMERSWTPTPASPPGPSPRLPGGRQDRHRTAGRRRLRLLRRLVLPHFAGFAPADDARFTVYVVIHAPGAAAAVARSPARSSPDHGLRALPLPRAADGHQALARPGRMVTREPPQIVSRA